jgi:UDP-N-acetylglucosamine--N-acetylmuramyl-(pentapeptide) pyrophosphoryl-undecaprenol N-acetylglucosamine transferase
MERFFAADKILKTGNPVRAALFEVKESQAEAKKALGFDPERKLVFVTGGSLGARTINDSVGLSLDAISATGASVLWQTGKLYADECVLKAQGYENVKAMPFISDMGLAYRAADIVVSRAGASTISELQIVGTPAILIPSPNVAEDHQRKNAQALVDKDAAVMILDAECKDKLAQEVTSLLNDEEKRSRMSANVLKMALRNADEKIVDTIYNILK